MPKVFGKGRRSKVVVKLREDFDFANFAESIFAAGVDSNQRKGEAVSKTDLAVDNIAFLAGVVGFDNMVKICVALGGETIKIPKLSSVSKKILAVKCAQQILNGSMTRKHANRVLKVPLGLLRNTMRMMDTLRIEKARFSKKLRKREIEAMFASFASSEVDPVLEESENWSEVENVDDNCPENGYNSPSAEDDTDESADDE